MKVPYSWLAEWTELPWKPAELGTRLTMAGFEVESLEPAAPSFRCRRLPSSSDLNPGDGFSQLLVRRPTAVFLASPPTY